MLSKWLKYLNAEEIIAAHFAEYSIPPWDLRLLMTTEGFVLSSQPRPQPLSSQASDPATVWSPIVLTDKMHDNLSLRDSAFQ